MHATRIEYFQLLLQSVSYISRGRAAHGAVRRALSPVSM